VTSSLADANAAVAALWPLDEAEDWDAPGLLSGDPASAVTRIHLAVDAVLDTVDEAIEGGAQLLVVHHPLLLRGVTSVAEDRYKGAAIKDICPKHTEKLKDKKKSKAPALPDLSYSYVYRFTPLMEQRLSQGGIRLAAYLNALFAEPQALPERPPR